MGIEQAEHLSGYQARDAEVVDYQMYQLDGTDLWFRGPEPTWTERSRFFTALGAAQTFGCFCERSYVTLLEKRVGIAGLNLGYGGAGPRFFNRHPELIDRVNQGRLAIVQVMSGRSEDNSKFESRGLEFLTRQSDGRRMSSDTAWRSILESRYLWKKLPYARATFRKLCRYFGKRQAIRLVVETRRNWCESYRELLGRIKVPKILVWFSQRAPDYVESFEDLSTLFGDYPQLVNRGMIDEIRAFADDYVECVTQRGSPQPLIHRVTGKPVTIDLGRDRDDFRGQIWDKNSYYPSPEMHEDLAEMLFHLIRQRL